MLTRLSAAELAGKLRAREVSAHEVANAFLERIEALDSQYGAFLLVAREEAMAMARDAQARLDAGDAGPLTGLPIALKDNIVTRGIATTCASRILEGWIPPYDAHVVRRIREEGMVLLGKTNLDEFAMGSSTERSAFGPSRNPWDPERSPGGSSGGSAVAVAAEMAPLALGSDTGGSIRQPAALCGIVGFKPTYGRCSRYGLVAFASSLDQIGPMARDVRDVALCARATTGHDPRDNTSLPAAPIDAGDLTRGTVHGKRFAVPDEFFGEAIHEGVAEVVGRALMELEAAGAVVERISLPSIRFGVTTYYIIAPSEASSNLARYDGVRFGVRSEGKGHIQTIERTRAEGFGREVKARILIGTYALSAGYYDAYFHRASQVRSLMTQEFEETFARYDFVAGPTCPLLAFKLGELAGDPLALKLSDYCTIPANLGGFPAISIPCGRTEGLPVGLQLVGPAMCDEELLRTAYAAEEILRATERPPIP